MIPAPSAFVESKPLAAAQAAARSRDGADSGAAAQRRPVSVESFAGGMRSLASGAAERVEDAAVGAADAVASVVRPVVGKAAKVVGIVPKARHSAASPSPPPN